MLGIANQMQHHMDAFKNLAERMSHYINLTREADPDARPSDELSEVMAPMRQLVEILSALRDIPPHAAIDVMPVSQKQMVSMAKHQMAEAISDISSIFSMHKKEAPKQSN